MERQPAVAGMFYPENKEELSAVVKQLIGTETSDERALAIVVPHAGYIYSGKIAGETYREIHVPNTAIVICPNHSGMGSRTAIICRGAFQIPGHRMPIDEVLAERVMQYAGLEEDSTAHLREHSLEVHLPFLVHRNPDVRIVPICISYISFDRCREIGQGIAKAIQESDKPVLIVASTDMSHHISSDAAEKQDGLALERVKLIDAEGLYETVLHHRISMCGFIPTTISLIAAKQLGATQARLIRYGNSGETSGDFQSVVGYAGFVVR